MTFPAVQSAFEIGPVSIHWYGLLVVVGIVVGYLICRYLLRVTRYQPRLDESLRVKAGALPVTSKNFDSLFFWLVIWGFIGGRLYHVLNEIGYYWQNPIEIVKIWNGGLAIHGSIVAGVIVIFFFSRKFSINDVVKSFFSISDVLVIGLVLGQAIGRWGNYFNQELFGKPTEGFFKVVIDLANRPAGFEDIAYYHPTFFYESVLNLLLFIVLLILFKRVYHVIPDSDPGSRKENKQEQTVIASERERSVAISVDAQNEIASQKPCNDSQKTSSYGLRVTGYVTAFYLLGYGLIRFFVDFYRIDPRPFFSGLYLSQWVSLGMVVVGIVMWYTVVIRRKK